MLLDEGPAHLDPATEAIVNQAITALGITRIVIAHRAETVRYATRVLVKLIEICFLRRSSRGRITEVAVEKGAANILMPISSCRQLNDLPDDLAAKITIHYYLDAKDALLKALAA